MSLHDILHKRGLAGAISAMHENVAFAAEQRSQEVKLFLFLYPLV
jgi:hypothetical protein